MALEDEKYLAFTTFRKTGDPVSTPVWVVPVSDGRVGFWTAMGTGKTKRLGRNPQVTVQPCDVRGRVRTGTTAVPGTAEMVQSGRLFDEVHAKVAREVRIDDPDHPAVRQAGGQGRKGLTYADTVVLVRLDETRSTPNTRAQIAQPSGPQASSPADDQVEGGRDSAQARSSTWPNTSAGWAPATPYFRSTTKNGTPVAPYATACADVGLDRVGVLAGGEHLLDPDLVEPDLGGEPRAARRGRRRCGRARSTPPAAPP